MILVLKSGATKEEMQLIRDKFTKSSKGVGIDLKKFAGIIKLKGNPTAIQKKNEA